MKKVLPYIFISIMILGGFLGIKTTLQAEDALGECVLLENGRERSYINMTKPACDLLVSNQPATRKFIRWVRYNPIGICTISTTKIPDLTKEQCIEQAKSVNEREYIWTPDYVLLAPFTEETNFNPASKNALGKYLNMMLKIFIGLCAVLAVIMIVVGGIEYMTSELVSSKEAGRHRMTEAVFGLIVALGAYALLNTINPSLLNTDFEIEDITVEVEFMRYDRVAQIPDPVTGLYPNGRARFNAPWDDTVAPTTPLPPHVTPNNPECTKIGQKKCTSTRGLNVSALKKVQEGCRCNLVLSGGTESWLHGGPKGDTTHALWSSTVDIRADNPILNKYIAGNKPLIKYRPYFNGDGNRYYYEGDHWHVGNR